MQTNIGGDRLGSGNKMNVDLHGYERSTQDLGYLWRSTMAAGTLVPFMKQLALPGDTWDINLGCDVKTHPTIGPLFGSYKVQLDIFQAPIRLYHALLNNNALNIGLKMSDVALPYFNLNAYQTTLPPDQIEDVDNMQINPSSIISYLGIRGVGINTENTLQQRSFQAIPLLAYWDIYKVYYANKQEEIGAVIHTPSIAVIDTVTGIEINTATLPEFPTTTVIPVATGSLIEITWATTQPLPNQIMLNTVEQGQKSAAMLFSGFTNTGFILTGTYLATIPLTITSWQMIDNTTVGQGTPDIQTFELANIDTVRTSILSWAVKGAPYNIMSENLPPYIYLEQAPNGIPNILSSQEGLGLKTYQSDLFNNWMNTEWIDGVGGISEITAVDVSGGTLQIDALILARKVYDMMNRIAISGGTYDDWIKAAYDHLPYSRCYSPMYMGGLIKELVFQEVVSNSATLDGAEPLGTLAGKGVMSNKHKGGNVTIKVDEPSYIIGIISLTPRLDYSQGNDWDVNLQTMDDLHKPGLDQIGFQELITEQMAWWDTHYDLTTSEWIQKSAGKQPAWLNYMTNVNQTRGNFAITTNEMFMTLNRRYEPDSSYNINDLTTYIDPSKFNHIFAQTSLDSQNFWTQIAVDITCRRKMSARIMPNL